jgi:sugar lactone lactonase YvrE
VLADDVLISNGLGGPGLDTLYILTGTDAEHSNPDGGSVFSTDAPSAGLPAPVAQVRRASKAGSGR